MDYVGSRYVPKIYENSQDPSSLEWEPGISWEPFIIVTFNLNAYISKKIIPPSVGDPASNPAYWAAFGFYNGQIASLNSRVALLEGHEAHSFECIADVDDVNIGDVVITRGFYTAGDGGSGIYVVVEDTTGPLPTILSDNGHYLMSASEPVNILTLGCKIGDLTFDNSSILNSMFAAWNCEYFAPVGNLHIDHTIVIPKDFFGGIHFDCNIHAYDVTDPCAVRVLCYNANEIYINGIYGNGTCNTGIALGGNTMDYYVINNTFVINRINNFVIGLKLEADNAYGTSNNKFFLRRIDNCDIGIEFEMLGSLSTDGFISQNQFYNVWVTGDGTNTKKGIVFVDNTTDHGGAYTENNFFNMSCEGCGTVIEADDMITCKFENIRLGEQGPLTLPDLFKIGSHCRYNKFSSSAPYVLYTNFSDNGEYNVYHFNFRDPVSTNELGDTASFRNGRFMLKGECLTNKVVNVGGETLRTIDPFRSVNYIYVNRIAADPVDIILPNNARESNYAPTLFIKLNQIGGGVRIKDVDGNVLASTDGSGGVAMTAGHVYIYYVNWNHSISINELV